MLGSYQILEELDKETSDKFLGIIMPQPTEEQNSIKMMRLYLLAHETLRNYSHNHTNSTYIPGTKHCKYYQAQS